MLIHYGINLYISWHFVVSNINKHFEVLTNSYNNLKKYIFIVVTNFFFIKIKSQLNLSYNLNEKEFLI